MQKPAKPDKKKEKHKLAKLKKRIQQNEVDPRCSDQLPQKDEQCMDQTNGKYMVFLRLVPLPFACIKISCEKLHFILRSINQFIQITRYMFEPVKLSIENGVWKLFWNKEQV